MKEVNAVLISGFLQAIHSFGIELIKLEDRSQTIKLEYQDSIILMSEFLNIRLIFIMKENPSNMFLYSVENFASDIYKAYGDSIDNFAGRISQFRGIEELVKRNFNASFLYPLKLANMEKLNRTKIAQNEKSIIDLALKVLKQKNSDYFYVSNLFGETNKFQVKDGETILKLIKKDILIPFSFSEKNQVSFKGKYDKTLPLPL
jgi:hypothetical protein